MSRRLGLRIEADTGNQRDVGALTEALVDTGYTLGDVRGPYPLRDNPRVSYWYLTALPYSDAAPADEAVAE